MGRSRPEPQVEEVGEVGLRVQNSLLRLSERKAGFVVRTVELQQGVCVKEKRK